LRVPKKKEKKKKKNLHVAAFLSYVSNLPFSFVDDDLKKIFAGFDVSSAYVATRRNGRSKGFGFVTFSSTDQQKKALDSFDGKELNGRTLTVRVAHKDDRRDAKGELKEEFKGAQESQPRRKRGANKEGGADRKEGGNGGAAAGGADKKPSDTILYVSNLPFEFTDADLTNVFKAHNPVSARIARRRNERSKGFGFVEFANHKDQQAALALDNHKVGDREISVKVSVAGDAAQKEKSENNNNAGGNKKNDEKRGGNKGGDAGARGGGAASGPSDTTLYVSNLPFDLTDAALGEVFRSRGHNPSNARIARRRDDRSKGFGFVEFANAAAQKAALAAVEKEGVTLGDRQISVKVAMKDSETRAAGDKDAAAAAPKGGKGKGGGAKKEENNNNNNNDGNEGGDGKRRRQRRRAGTGGAGGAGAANGDRPAADNKPRAEKKDSETLVYVSNLSFDVDDNVLAKLFDGLTIKSAHVAVRRNGRSKGFGFVEFASHADQQKALQRTGVELHGRKLTVEVAKENVENK
jgi:RNA recognition motif-containing protein